MSTKPYEDDPILTAYALGELEPDEARDVEARLADDAAARDYVDQVRATAQRLMAALRAEPAPSTHRQETPVAADGGRTRSWRWHQALAMAASLAVVGLLGASFFLPELNRSGDLSERTLALAPNEETARTAESTRETLSNAASMGPAESAQADRLGKGGARIRADKLPAARERYQQGLELELAGDDAGAAAAYSDVLKLDATFDAAAQRLQAVQEQQSAGPSQDRLANFERQRQVQRELIGQTFGEALGQAQAGVSSQNPDQARAALQQAQAARDTNPGIFDNEQLGEMDRQIASLRSQINSAEAPMLEQRTREERSRLGAEAIAQGVNDRRLPAASTAAPAGIAGQAQQQGGQMPSAASPDPARAEEFTEGATLGTGVRGGLGDDGNSDLKRRIPADPMSQPHLPGRFRDDFNTEQYDRIVDNEFKRVGEHPLSTFSVDVDTASYSNLRRFLDGGQLPPPDAVRIEELINYFDYTYEPPPSESQHPFAARVAVADAPWNPQHRLVRIGIKGREIPQAERPSTNLVFLLDVSGSMQPQNKLPLVKRAMSLLAQQLDERDRIAIVVYAGSSGLVLPSTTGDRRADILAALEKLEAGGSTNGGEGIQLAYQVARQNLIKGGVNRVILCTDGDFNIGVTDRGQLTRLIEEQAKSGVYLSILGFGMDNLKDATLEELTNKGEGNYGYIDTEHEARKLLVEQMQGALQAIAKDVKIQVEFNPAEVGSYRLIGYENRILAKEDFNDDTKDAGDIGAGHEVTALYEVVPVEVQAKTNEARLAQLRDLEKKYLEIQAVAGQTPDGRAPHEAELAAVRAEIEALTKNQPAPPVDDLKYQEKPAAAPAAASGEMLTVKLRYKGPEEAKEQGTSTLIEFPLKDEPRPLAEMDQDFRHAASVAGFGMLLRDSPYKGTLTWPGLEELTRPLEELRNARLTPEGQRRLEFRDLAQKAAALSRGNR